MRRSTQGNVGRQRVIAAAIGDTPIPEPVYGKGTEVPQEVKDIVKKLRDDGVYSQSTYERDIWRAMYRVYQELKC